MTDTPSSAGRPILAWWSVPHATPPSTPVRLVGPALVLALLAFLLFAVGGMLLLWHALDGIAPWNQGCGRWCWHPGPWEVVSYLPFDPWDQPWAVYGRTVPGAVVGLAVGTWLFSRALRPVTGIKHVMGPELLRGQDALLACRGRGNPGDLLLHPSLPLEREAWTRSVLVVGGVGSGKTQIIEPVVEQIAERGLRALVLDTKGDYTSHFPRAAILSPWDARTCYWDIAADVCTVADAQALAAALVPPSSGTNRHWDDSSRAIMTGVIVALQKACGDGWGWGTFSRALAAGYNPLREMLQEAYPEAVALLGEGTSSGTATSSALASLAGHTQVVHNLARAWGDGEVPGRSGPMERLSLKAWARGKSPRSMILLHAGADSALSRAWLSAAFAVAGQTLLSLPDSRHRLSFLVLDEMTAVRLHLDGLIERGRSKGVCCIAGFQDLAQVAQVYGEHTARALPAMVGTQVICRVAPGETRERVSKWLGQRRVLVRTHTRTSAAGGGSEAHGAHEEMRPVVAATELSELGPRRTKKGFVIEAIVARGGDVLLLAWPGREWKKRRRPRVPARWTRPGGATISREPSADDVGP